VAVYSSLVIMALSVGKYSLSLCRLACPHICCIVTTENLRQVAGVQVVSVCMKFVQRSKGCLFALLSNCLHHWKRVAESLVGNTASTVP